MLQFSSATELRLAAEGEEFFDKASPFDDLDVVELEPMVKQTPLLDYAEGTALFIRARSKQADEGLLTLSFGLANK